MDDKPPGFAEDDLFCFAPMGTPLFFGGIYREYEMFYVLGFLNPILTATVQA